MPVQKVAITRGRSDGQAWENIKALYLCEVCQAPANFGFTFTTNNQRKRLWFCGSHRQEAEEAWRKQER